MTDHNGAAPLAVPNEGQRYVNYPAGWVNPVNADAAGREAHRLAILAEQEEAAKAEVEAEIKRRIAAIHAAGRKQEVNEDAS